MPVRSPSWESASSGVAAVITIESSSPFSWNVSPFSAASRTISARPGPSRVTVRRMLLMGLPGGVLPLLLLLRLGG